MVRPVDYKTRPIDPDFISKAEEYPSTGEHLGHKVRAEGKVRMSGEPNVPYPTTLGIHGTQVAVDWESCIADGVCMDVCPVFVFEWALNPGQAGTGKDKVLQQGSDEWNKYRTDKSDPVREPDCIFCMACETSCPTQAIKITQQ
ncbi:MAG: ferredoxin family protein [Nitrososphaerota archaeon]|nr:ferredoxin family protein [Nitrososphaerota archaeon]